ncbi:btb poz domain-containing [Trichoderma arundinaceum]|uniref:Btb poz domain-containing n=1 Tax=Trichoderma arundinaceum TaxID=490622 RepID=A0A395NB84_TRIAR|nr:btb poz domain-containing [Trichoderma arundinaceum]
MKVVIDIEGDILLQLPQSTIDVSSEQSKDEQLRKQALAVSSKVLCLASPVFKAMLRSSFKEAVNLMDHTTSLAPYSLDLPEDDTEAMTVLSKSFTLICTGPMNYCGTVWMRNWFQKHDEKATSIDDLCQVLIFAYHEALMSPLNKDWYTLTEPCYKAAKAVGSYLNSLHKAFLLRASAVFAWYISGGEVVTVLSQPPPQRFHLSGRTHYQKIEEPIIMWKMGNRPVKQIVVVHPTITGPGDFTYQMWPVG